MKKCLVPVFGMPGSGKGSMIRALKDLALKEEMSISVIEMGNYFREQAKKDAEIKKIIENGNFVPDSVVNEAFKKMLDVELNAPKSRIIIIDGYPRNQTQAEVFFRDILNKRSDLFLSMVFVEISEKEVLHRADIRRICPLCGGTFSAELHAVCPYCKKHKGERRKDDEQMPQRLQVYKDKTLPLERQLKDLNADSIVVSGYDTQFAAQQVLEFLSR